ncbi:hypothetical protein SAMD00020551_1038 [Mesobacillus selenatarsenatis SF-1]|uniref:Uncharacterized protein n=1 Tax=Mesobacillus selenatarsenatis (strain DSM 18680 / JCM 14380 / FERM P-15431 / SF-1) TaxID=1321606 RepID=A0A0A8WZ53_MESS1|nr:hypothetical protein SAMD00020551_1038 [Mesobacillus selenatarsenatis SF-1]
MDNTLANRRLSLDNPDQGESTGYRQDARVTLPDKFYIKVSEEFK